MKIEIKVKIGDLQVDFDEAKKIYEALKPLFENQNNNLLEIYKNKFLGSPKNIPDPWDYSRHPKITFLSQQ